jgi:hypothetical protein
LVFLELKYFWNRDLKYSYEVDYDHTSKLKLNIDITVAMPCNSLGADVMDSTSKDILTDQQIDMIDTWFEMSPNQKKLHERISNIYKIIRREYHALHSSLWFSFNDLPSDIGEREDLPNREKDACRIHGTFDLNKVAGNMHIIYGKSISFFGNHAHVVNMMSNTPSNFSHRIDDFSFGDNSNLVHNALNCDLKTTDSDKTSFQYFINVVATEIGSTTNTYQYSVTEKSTEVDHDQGNHGTPGIFFKYDMSPIKVRVSLARKSIFQLLVSLIGIIGGIFSTSMMLNSLFQIFYDLVHSKANK